MKKLYIIRHAKSSWSDSSLSGFDRPLNNRGLRDAPFMAKMLKGRGVKVDKIISSPANRAFTTANYFAQEFNVKESEFLTKKDLYHGYPREILKNIQNFGEDAETLLVFGHNPGFTNMANLFTEDYIANVPTCGIVEISFSGSSWKTFNKENGKLTAFYYPKMYF